MRGEGWRVREETAEMLAARRILWDFLETWTWAGNYMRLRLTAAARTKAASVKNPRMSTVGNQSHYFAFRLRVCVFFQNTPGLTVDPGYHLLWEACEYIHPHHHSRLPPRWIWFCMSHRSGTLFGLASSYNWQCFNYKPGSNRSKAFFPPCLYL